ncbi:copper homeostasis protein CutC [Gordonia humi]|uniref:Copper homeostasis protein cutC homolog n=1 Tax=Gordonia humi TaxID=686429 RepID=A0A840EYV2_9ACTN|nr:copper homeostasis protein [Gordonia humi]
MELCAALGATGGLTPSIGAVRTASATGIDVHVLIRCRPGGFVYSRDEIEVMAFDVAAVVAAGARGVVVGALRADGSVDEAAVAGLVGQARAAGEVDVTFHRALDAAADPVAALRTVAALGVDRVLTSGGAAAAGEGLDMLARLVAEDTGVQVMAGGGVRPETIPALVDVGVDAVHLSAKTVIPDPGATGPGGGAGGGIEVTDPDIVAAARTSAHSNK